MCVEPRGDRLVLNLGRVDGRKARLDTRKLELAVKRQGAGRQQRGQAGWERVASAPKENEAAVRARHSASNLDAERL